MQNFVYPVQLTPDKKDGGFVVTFPDLPEAITQGEDRDDSLREAADCLEEAIANRIMMNLTIPIPSSTHKFKYAVPLSGLISAKAALYLAISEANISKVELARRLRCDEKEIRRLIDPRHPSKLPRIESALAALGRQLVVGVQVAI